MASGLLGSGTVTAASNVQKPSIHHKEACFFRTGCNLVAVPACVGHPYCGTLIRRRFLLQPLHAKRRDPIIAPVIPIGDGEDYCDMFNYLLRNRIVFVSGRITDQSATQIIASLLALEAIDETAEIKLYINSAGGQAYSILAIIDCMMQLKCDISTVAFGMVASTSSLILAAGTPGKRYSMPNSRIMLRQAQGGAGGSAFEVTITTAELNRTNQVLNMFYSRFTGMSLEKVEEETDRENYLGPAAAIELGLIDAVV